MSPPKEPILLEPCDAKPGSAAIWGAGEGAGIAQSGLLRPTEHPNPSHQVDEALGGGAKLPPA
jgi:hypothetical protein